MNKTSFLSKVKLSIAIIAILFVVYNILVFVVAGFDDHGSAFWWSYAFMVLSMVVVAVCAWGLRSRDMQPKDVLLGYPFYRHCVSYIIIEIVCSTLFMMLDRYNWSVKIALVVQLIVAALFVVLLISCFMAKGIIEEVQQKTETSTMFMKTLLIDVETMESRAASPEVKKAFSKLREEIRYSDPVSTEQLVDVENRLRMAINQASIASEQMDVQNALQYYENAMVLLSERNRKCKLYKEL